MSEAFCTLLPSPTISPSRAVTDRVERPSQLAENGRVGTRRGWAGDGGTGRSRGGRRRAQIADVETAHIGIDGDGRRAFAVDAEQDIGRELARAHLQGRDIDLEGAALGGGLGAQRIRTARRHRQADIGAEDRDIRPLGIDLHGGALDADAALDGDLAAAEAALQVDVAGQAPHPAVERAGRAREIERRRLGCREATLDLHAAGWAPTTGGWRWAPRSRPADVPPLRRWSGPNRAPRWRRSRETPWRCAGGANGSRPRAGPIRRAAAACRGWRRPRRCVSTRMSAPSSRTRPILISPRKSDDRIEEQGELAHPRQVGARSPRGVGQRDALRHHAPARCRA